jgi:hypothetical protein
MSWWSTLLRWRGFLEVGNKNVQDSFHVSPEDEDRMRQLSKKTNAVTVEELHEALMVIWPEITHPCTDMSEFRERLFTSSQERQRLHSTIEAEEDERPPWEHLAMSPSQDMGGHNVSSGSLSPGMAKSSTLDSVAIEQLIGRAATPAYATTRQRDQLWEEIVQLREDNATLRVERVKFSCSDAAATTAPSAAAVCSSEVFTDTGTSDGNCQTISPPSPPRPAVRDGTTRPQLLLPLHRRHTRRSQTEPRALCSSPVPPTVVEASMDSPQCGSGAGSPAMPMPEESSAAELRVTLPTLLTRAPVTIMPDLELRRVVDAPRVHTHSTDVPRSSREGTSREAEEDRCISSPPQQAAGASTVVGAVEKCRTLTDCASSPLSSQPAPLAPTTWSGPFEFLGAMRPADPEGLPHVSVYTAT